MNISTRRNVARRAGRVAATLAVIGSAFAGATVATSPANAAAYGPSYCNASSCSLSNSASSSQIYFEMPRGSGVSMICWTDAGWYAGTNRWFKVRTIYGSGIGWMSANQVGNQTRVGHC